jgi:polysaccharide export outer membrane protein
MNRWFLMFCLLFVLPGCWWKASPETPQPGVEPGKTSSSTLGPGDVFEVKVYDEKELSGIYRVSSSGLIDFPLVGRLKASGLTSSDMSALLKKELGSKFLRDPQVSIFIKEYNSKKISVFGEVSKPGTFMFEDGMSVIQAVSMAGGFTKMASKNNTNITRLVDGVEKRYTIPVEAIASSEAKNFFLLPGDIIYVPESIW